MQASEITKLYKSVIEEVIKNVRNDFVNMGVDEQVLYDLQMLWEQKLMDYKIVSPSEYFGTSASMMNTGNNIFISHNNIGNQLNPVGLLPQHQHEGGLNVLANGAMAASSTGAANGGYPYPTNPTDNYGYIRPNNRTTYYHPSQGYFEASSTVAPTAANLPNATPSINTNHPPIKPQQQQQQQKPPHNNRRYDGGEGNNTNNNEKVGGGDPDDIIKLLYTNGEEEVILDKVKKEKEAELLTQIQSQVASTAAAASESLENDEINSDLDDDDDEDDKDADAEGYDESGTMDENVVLCQYEKVNRTRNKWRCVFKSGIIHVNGADYVFSKANGEFEW